MTETAAAGTAPATGDALAPPVGFCAHCGAPLDVQAFVQE